MNPLKKQRIAKQIWDLEQGNDSDEVTFNKIYEIASKLAPDELLEIAEYIEDKLAKIQNL